MAQNTLIYPSHYELMEELTNEQAGLLIKTIGRYQRGEDINISDNLVKGIWLGIKHHFDKQTEHYNKVVERNRKNGKQGGRPKTQDNPKNPSGLVGFLNNPKNPSGLSKTQGNPNNLKDKDKDKKKDKEKYKKKVIPSTDSSREIKVDNFKRKPEYNDSLSIQMEKQFDEIFKDI